MNLQIASDLHLDTLWPVHPRVRVVEPDPRADLLVLAGDIHAGPAGLAAFADWPVPVIVVPGNHEYYDAERHAMRRTLAEAAAATAGHVRLLDDAAVVIDGVRFVGSTLWADYAIDGADRVDDCQALAARRLVDHRVIREGDDAFAPAHALAQHRRSRAWLAEQLARPHDGPTVVITHHGCHRRSVHERFAGDAINGAFISDLSPLLGPRERCALWIHGHVHNSFDYEVQGTRVVVNPRGYALNRREPDWAAMRWENPQFDARLVVQV